MSDQKDAQKILRAMNDVDDSFIKDAIDFADANLQHNRRNRYLNKTVKMISVVAACFAVFVVGYHFIKNYDQPTEKKVSETVSNPYQEFKSLDAAEDAVGFKLKLPENKSSDTDRSINVIDGKMIEVSYSTGDAGDSAYYVRKAKGSDDISGDTSDYTSEKTIDVKGTRILLKGNSDGYSLAVWTSNGYTYAIGVQNHPISEENMMELVENTR